MFRPAGWLLIFLSLALSFGCGKKNTAPQLSRPTKLAVLTIADEERKKLSPKDGVILQQALDWLDRDIARRLHDRGFEIALLPDMKNYTSAMGPLLTITVESFEAGMAANQPYRQPSGFPSAIIAEYKLVDARGGLLEQWKDGAESIKGATYCARTLNMRSVEKITAVFQER